MKAIGRAGAGVNNIPVEAMSKRGVPVFNAPGANANAVKELVLAGMLIAARNLVPARGVREFARRHGDDFDTPRRGRQEAVRRHSSCRGRTLGIIGLGKIGSLVADAAIKLGMNVLGYDPEITVDAAWSLPAQVKTRGVDRRGAQGERLRHAARAAHARRRGTSSTRSAWRMRPRGSCCSTSRATAIVDEAAVVAGARRRSTCSKYVTRLSRRRRCAGNPA